MKSRHDFPVTARLRRPAEFQAVLKGGRRVHQSMLTAVAKPGTGSDARLGFAISARTVPRALDRNRLKRLTRESFRLNRNRMGTFDIVIMARAGAAEARPQQVRDALEVLWQKFPAARA